MSNRLASTTSPYLRQHADNPVDWWPWCDEALATARREGKPILLSIGYSACHWCHVMAHESFEDDATARVMNALYVNIKVDREERPDIDKVYQLAHQALARRGGGWPLTVFLTPDDLLPFYAGTYFPNAPRHGMPAFMQVLEGVRRWYDDKPDDVRAQNASLAGFLREHDAASSSSAVLDDVPIKAAFARIAGQFDADNGGRRGGPKFPHAPELDLLRRRARGDGANAAAAMTMLQTTLLAMAERGLRDHLGGGFFRYCVDATWDIPHFEKMLYDNAQLLPHYAEATRVFTDDTDASLIFAAVARECAHWMIAEMTASNGGFMSALDADSEGEEGRYYVWQRDDVRAALDAHEYAFVAARFGLDAPPNFEGEAWHLRAAASSADAAAAADIATTDAVALWTSARAKVLAIRAQRVRPGLDDKILTAWNALAISGAARALQAMPDLDALREHADRALDFVHANLWRDGRLHATHARGQTRIDAFLDDHAFLIDALLAMLRLRWRSRDLDLAIALADALLTRFEDDANGGFFFTANDAEALPQRPKPWFDEALPAGNGVAARALLELGRLIGDTRYLDAAERTLRAGWHALEHHPEGCCTLLGALDDFLSPPTHVVLRADDGDEATRWSPAIEHWRDGEAHVYRVPSEASDLPGVLAAQTHSRGGVAYVCRGVTCAAPITDPADIASAE